jgi:EpsG family
MLLSSFTLVICLFAILALAPMRLHSSSTQLSNENWSIVLLGGLICLIMILALALRNLNFGVDTATYAGIFNSYCAGQSLSNFEVSFVYSAQIINALMLGRCDSQYLPISWVLFIFVALMLSRGKMERKIIYISLLFTSMIGIELSTNALRQGFSIALLITAFSYYRYNNFLALLLALACIALHSSSALVILLFGLCALRLRLFILCCGAVAAFIFWAIQSGASLLFASRFIYEIQKYLEHDADEIAIRLLAYASMLLVIFVPLLVLGDKRKFLLKTKEYFITIKLLIVCTPFLFLPYFGYRLIYGVFPIVLWLIVSKLQDEHNLTLRIFLALLGGNLLLLWTWSAGSSYMKSIPFLV